MKKILSYLLLIFIIILVVLFQVYIIDSNSLFGVKPNLILVVVIVSTLWYDIYKGNVLAIMLGAYLDILFGNNFMIYTIGYFLTSCFVGILTNSYRKENKISVMYLTLLGTLLFETVLLIISFIYNKDINLFYFIKQSVIAMILNLVLSYILYGVFVKISNFVDDNILERYI